MSNLFNDTIVGIATALTNNAISIIRVSGDDAIEIVLAIGRIPEIRLGNGKILTLGNDNITREQLVVFLYRYAKLKNKGVSASKISSFHRFFHKWHLA